MEHYHRHPELCPLFYRPGPVFLLDDASVIPSVYNIILPFEYFTFSELVFKLSTDKPFKRLDVAISVNWNGFLEGPCAHLPMTKELIWQFPVLP